MIFVPGPESCTGVHPPSPCTIATPAWEERGGAGGPAHGHPASPGRRLDLDAHQQPLQKPRQGAEGDVEQAADLSAILPINVRLRRAGQGRGGGLGRHSVACHPSGVLLVVTEGHTYYAFVQFVYGRPAVTVGVTLL